jgi:hypothetical protein
MLVFSSMEKTIRDVPGELHRTSKARAAKAGMPLSDHLLSEIGRIAEKPTLAEMIKRLRQREPADLDEPPNVTIRRIRDADGPRDVGQAARPTPSRAPAAG